MHASYTDECRDGGYSKAHRDILENGVITNKGEMATDARTEGGN